MCAGIDALLNPLLIVWQGMFGRSLEDIVFGM
ncbi:hypothetical protein SDC9_186162 [bioreactor metagenome]|uniref:Uncharacterized protein n=1 Tax=bioreactor metagenome TaxID=1076179 RepID=A0A645HHX9_9ZZZZ